MTLTSAYTTGIPVPFQRNRRLLQDEGVQEGVVGANDLKVAQRAAGANMSVDVAAGSAWVQLDTGANNGLVHVLSDAVANVAVTASDATNPRIDQVLLRYNDTAIPTGSGNSPTIEVRAGTPTAGATLDNRSGAVTGSALNDTVRLADVLVPAASSSVTTANIRDRRPWARGAFTRVSRAATDLTTAAGTLTAMDTTNLRARVECSGAPMRITLQGIALHSVAATNMVFGVLFDGVQQENLVQQSSPGVGLNSNVAASIITVPTPGSHVIDAGFATAAATMTVRATATNPFYMTIEELVRPNANNT